LLFAQAAPAAQIGTFGFDEQGMDRAVQNLPPEKRVRVW
jgi:hypothetical protein